MADEAWPLPKFNFTVDIDGEEYGFQEVSGLEMETEFAEYRSGDSRTLLKQKIPTLKKFGNLSLKRGVFEGDSRLWDWWQEVQEDHTNRVPMTIHLDDENGEHIITWAITNAFPIKISAPDMKADDGGVAIESIEIAHEGITLES